MEFTADPYIGTKDTARVDACPVDWIHPKKNTSYNEGNPASMRSRSFTLTGWSASIAAAACRSVSAILAMDHLPDKWKQFAEINAS